MVLVARICFAVLCLFVWAGAVISAPPERSISISRQFLVYGADVRMRGAICDLAERTKRDLLELIDRRDEWTTPIIVNARYPQANFPDMPRIVLNLAQTGFGLKIQLDLTIDLAVSGPEIRRELLRALLLELMYRCETNLPAGAVYVPPPNWLLNGIPPRQSDFDRGNWIDVLAAPLATGKYRPLKEFLRPEELSDLDAPSRFLYRAYSIALVELLVQTPDGRGRLARLITDLPFASNDPITDLGLYFPELSNESSAEKAWSLHLARLAAVQPFQLLSTAEVELKLDELLLLRISGADVERTYRLEEFPQFIRQGSSKLILARLSRDLSVFATRANPICRPMILEYARIGALLARGKTNGIAERLKSLRASRRGIVVQMRKINDYMNWFEATKAQSPSGAFTDYFKAAELGSAPEERRHDRISVYLDALETEFQDSPARIGSQSRCPECSRGH